LQLWERIVAGGAAGVAFWVWALPVDCIKTVMEASVVSSSSIDNNDNNNNNNSNSNSSRSKSSSSSMNLNNSNKLRRSIGIFEAFSQIRNRPNGGGIFNLFSAWPVALGRGIPAAAVTLTVYDMCMEKLN